MSHVISPVVRMIKLGQGSMRRINAAQAAYSASQSVEALATHSQPQRSVFDSQEALMITKPTSKAVLQIDTSNHDYAGSVQERQDALFGMRS